MSIDTELGRRLMRVSFVFTNPRHHLEMMAPVAGELAERGVHVELVSLAELRGLDTPKGDGRIKRAIPINLRRRNASPAAVSARAAPRSAMRARLAAWKPGDRARRLVWTLGLGLRMRQLIAGADVVVVPNDAVFPYLELLALVRKLGARAVLMQEGIRFPLPVEDEGATYGGGAVTAVCAWGEGSKQHFVERGVVADKIAVTGAPRLDGLAPEAWRAQAAQLVSGLGLGVAPIAFLSNPIEIQGYGTRAAKLELFARFLAESAPILRAQRIPVIVKNHPNEDPGDYARAAAASAVADLVTVVGAAPIFAVIAASRAAIVLTSTVGLEALVFGLPIGALEIPGHGFPFEYVQRGAAVALSPGTMAGGVSRLLDGDPSMQLAGRSFVERHLHDRGRARYNVADVIERIGRGTK